MNTEQQENDYNALVDAYDHDSYHHGYSNCIFPFTFQEYLDNKDKCMKKYKYVSEHKDHERDFSPMSHDLDNYYDDLAEEFAEYNKSINKC